jgi:hypothetical protein
VVLSVEDKRELVEKLLVWWSVSDADRLAALTLLRLSDNQELAVLFDPAAGLLGTVLAGIVEGSEIRGRLDWFLEERFVGGAVALMGGVVRPQGRAADDRERAMENRRLVARQVALKAQIAGGSRV